MTVELPSAYPLQWPHGWPRAKRQLRAGFGPTTLAAQIAELRDEMRRLGARRWVLSTNVRLKADGYPYSQQKKVLDPGVAVYFTLKGHEHVLACDLWDRVEHNLRAVVKHIDALRGQQRWGVGTIEQAFAGYVGIPAETGGRPWWDVLGVSRDANAVEIQRAYKRRARESHPDTEGGTPEKWHELQQALKEAVEAVRS